MDEYPEKSCSIDRLVRQTRLVAAAIAGDKTQQRRDGIYGFPGDKFSLQGITFVITTLERKSLGDMTDADAHSEGFPGLQEYKDLILKMHAGMTWESSHLVWVHHFNRHV